MTGQDRPKGMAAYLCGDKTARNTPNRSTPRRHKVLVASWSNMLRAAAGLRATGEGVSGARWNLIMDVSTIP